MNKYIPHIIALLLSLSLLSCSNRDNNGHSGEEGYMSLNLSTSEQTIPGTKATKAIEPLYAIDIINKSGDTVVSYPDHTQLPASFKVLAGQYTVSATSGNSNVPGFDKPSFYGQTNAAISVNQQTAVSITAKLNNVVATLQLEQAILDGFSRADLIIYDSETGEEIFTITKADIGKLAYLPVKASYEWKLILVNNQGTANSLSGDITEVVACNRFDFTFKISAPGSDSEGVIRLDITIDRDLIEFEHVLAVAITDDVPPSMEYKGNFVGGQPISVNELLRGKTVRYEMVVPSAIKEVWFYHEVEAFENAGIPAAVKLTHIDAEMRGKLVAQGINFSQILFGQESGYIDFSEFCNKAPLGEYAMRFTLEDKVSHYLLEQVKVMVMPDQDHMVLSVDEWAKFATVSAEWYTLEKPEGITVEYRKDGDADWIKSTAENLTFDDQAQTFTAKLKNLEPNTKYQYRTFSDVKEGAQYSFTTEDAVAIPNIDFQKWAFGNSAGGLMGRVNTWYPNAAATNWESFWSTGNEGTSMTQAASRNITYPDEDPVYGKVVKMESIWINATFAKTFAAGNLFSGYFAVNTGNPIMSAKLGRPYQGRPLGLKGRYKYISKKINRNAGGGSFNQYIGQDDKGIAYIKLENWGNPNIKPENFGSGNQPSGVTKIPVGYGEIQINDTNGEWVEFTFKVNYSDTTIKPTHITFASSASIYGENFCGGEGSTLWITGFELLWDE